MPSKINKRLLIVSLAILIGYFVFFRDYEVTSDPNWPSGITGVKRYVNPFTGRFRIVDAQTGHTLFSYSVDPHFQPVQIEKISDTKWSVTFEGSKK